MRNLPLVLTLSLAACGSVVEDSIGPDASPSEEEPDANLPSPEERGAVTIRVGVPSASRFLFLDPDGSLVADRALDVNHEAQAEVLPGGSIVVVGPRVNPNDVVRSRIYAGVRPGDVVDERVTAYATTSTPIEVRVPTVAGADRYDVTLACGGGAIGGGPIIAVEKNDACGATTDIFVWASTEGVTQQTLLRRGVSLGAVVDLSAEALAAPAARTLRATGLGNHVDGANLSLDPIGAPDWILPGGVFGGGVPSGGEIAETDPYPTLDTAQAAARVDLSRDGFGQRRFEYVGALRGDVDVNVGDVPLPWVGPVALDAATATVSWVTDGAGTPDAIYTRLRNFPSGSGPGAGRFIVEVLARGDAATSLVLPRLPAPYAEGNVTPDAGWLVQAFEILATDAAGDRFSQILASPGARNRPGRTAHANGLL